MSRSRPWQVFACTLVALSSWASAGASPPSGQPAAAALEGTTWTLVALGERKALADAPVSLSFGAGELVSGSNGCNRYTGAYRVDGAVLSITPGASTMMACAEPVMQQAGEFSAVLAATRQHRIEAGRLVLLDEKGGTLATFEAMRPASLAGSRWTATAVNNGREAVVSLAEGTEITATFGTDGTLSGNAGCNQYTATYTYDGQKIAIRPPALTRRACPEPVLQQERDYVAALARAATFHIDGAQLQLRSATDSLQVFYRRPDQGQ